MGREGLCEGRLPKRGSGAGAEPGGSRVCGAAWLVVGARETGSAITTVVEFLTVAISVLGLDAASPGTLNAVLGTEL